MVMTHALLFVFCFVALLVRWTACVPEYEMKNASFWIWYKKKMYQRDGFMVELMHNGY